MQGFTKTATTTGYIWTDDETGKLACIANATGAFFEYRLTCEGMSARFSHLNTLDANASDMIAAYLNGSTY